MALPGPGGQIGWMGSAYHEGYGQMLEYLQVGFGRMRLARPLIYCVPDLRKILVRISISETAMRPNPVCLQGDLGTGIMPILNVGNTQEVVNAKGAAAKVAHAGAMARTFSNSSFLAYYIFDEVCHAARTMRSEIAEPSFMGGRFRKLQTHRIPTRSDATRAAGRARLAGGGQGRHRRGLGERHLCVRAP